MPAGSNATKLADLFDPEVVADYIDQKLIDGIRLSPLARIDTTLVGRPGDELTMPYYNYVGDSVAVAEGADIPIAKLTQGTKKVKVAKIGRAIEFTDEAMLSGYDNDIAREAADQVVVATNSKVEADLIAKAASDATLTASIAASATNVADGIADALTKFGEDIDGEKVLVIPPEFYARLRKSEGWIPNTEIGGEMLVRGVVGMVHGCQVITSNRLKSVTYDTYAKTTDSAISSGKTYYILNDLGEYEAVASPAVADIGKYFEKSSATGAVALVIKPGALAIAMKRDTLVEFDRDIIAETNYIKASKLFAPYVYDTSKLIRIALPTA